jgi:hypothetical protein
MKFLLPSLLALCLAASLPACGGGGSSPLAPAPSSPSSPTDGGPGGGGTGGGTDGGGTEPPVTAVGAALGQPTSARIGPAGGTLVSGDGQATLTVPAGALSAATTITMTPISNEAPAGAVGAWRFEPDGLVFARPANLRLSGLTAEDQARLALATQAADGHWQVAGGAAMQGSDALSVPVPHFSDWAFHEAKYLMPRRADVTVGDSLIVHAMDLSCDTRAEPGCDLLTPLVGNATVLRWEVNGVSNGNAQVGTLTPAGGSPAGAQVRYTAPQRLPSPNPVAVTAVLAGPGRSEIHLVAHLRVVPAKASWSGEIHVSFLGQRVDRDDTGESRHQVLFEATHEVEDVVVDSQGDGRQVTATLLMTVPTVDYRLQSATTLTGQELLSEQFSRQASGFYDDMGYQPVVTVQGLSDGRMQVPLATLLTYLAVRGQETVSHHDITTGHTTVTRTAIDLPMVVGPDLGSVPTGVVLRDPATGAAMGELPGTVEGQLEPGTGPRTWRGHTVLDNVGLDFQGQAIPGALEVTWTLIRRGG